MKKYKKFKKRRAFNPYIVFVIAIIGICTMSIGYAISTDTLTISGRANAKYPTHTITYVLNRGTNPVGAVTEYNDLEDVPLPIPTREGFLFLGWYEDDVFESAQLTTTSELSGDVTLYAKWKSANYYYQEYRHDEAYVFDGTNYLDSGIALYSEENWQKDFEIGFTIESYNWSNQVNQATFVNSKLEDEAAGYPGVVIRRLARGNTYEVTETINGVKVAPTFYNTKFPITIKLFRINGEIYYSTNDGQLIFLQDMSNFNHPFDTTTWFGAAEDANGSMMRGVVATMSNMYVKLEEYETRKYTVTFATNGGTVSEPTRRVKEHTEVGPLPTPTYERRNFLGWYKDAECTVKANESMLVNEDITLYAKWSDELNVRYDGVYYATLTEVLSKVPQSDEYVTVKVYDNLACAVTIGSGKKVILDLENVVLSNSGNSAVITVNGALKIYNGIITCDSNNAAVNVSSTGVVEITGGELIGTGEKQALWNNGGNVTISGSPIFSACSTTRPAVHNINNGTMTITGGTIISYGQNGIYNQSGTLTIGTEDGTVDTSSPVIQGKKYGLAADANQPCNLYDGVLIGEDDSINSISRIVDVEDNYKVGTSNKVVDGVTYKMLYLVPQN